ncbi:butyrophilin subfamily 1 member A1-like [Clarias gariepinus]|uniref:butyrophilin subfamily 1 member A1-like n=1 Tax=Clarias gariepinus TaxID=13013 RepID=UPI00234C70AD|nr:butyrophilin subfamily 1 member A1-like [Clarias gariepinus]
MKEVLVCFGVVFLCSGFLMASDVFTLNCAESVIMGKFGSSVILPCWLTPEINAETLEIRWYRPEKFQAPFQFYQSGKFITDNQGSYRNRSSLSPRNPQSTGLNQGDVSLRLDNLGMSDIGIFHCYVSGDKSYQDKSVNLSLTALGSPAHLSLQHLQDSVNLSCSSCGWFPQPRLLWNSPNEKGDALSNTQSPVYRQQENGLFCAYGWVILSSSFSKSISCSVSLSEDEKRDMSFDLDARPSDDTSGLWKILFGLLLFLLAALIGVGLYKIYSARKKHDYMPGKTFSHHSFHIIA